MPHSWAHRVRKHIFGEDVALELQLPMFTLGPISRDLSAIRVKQLCCEAGWTVHQAMHSEQRAGQTVWLVRAPAPPPQPVLNLGRLLGDYQAERFSCDISWACRSWRGRQGTIETLALLGDASAPFSCGSGLLLCPLSPLVVTPPVAPVPSPGAAAAPSELSEQQFNQLLGVFRQMSVGQRAQLLALEPSANAATVERSKSTRGASSGSHGGGLARFRIGRWRRSPRVSRGGQRAARRGLAATSNRAGAPAPLALANGPLADPSNSRLRAAKRTCTVGGLSAVCALEVALSLVAPSRPPRRLPPALLSWANAALLGCAFCWVGEGFFLGL